MVKGHYCQGNVQTMANAIQLLQLLKASLSIEECKERYQKHFKPFIISCIDSKERIKLLKEYFKLEGLNVKLVTS